MSELTLSDPLVRVFKYAESLAIPPPSRPWSVSVDGVDWLVATNGHVLLARKSSELGEPVPERLAQVQHYLVASIESPRPVTLTDLKAFAGAVQDLSPVTCQDCRGEGYQSWVDTIRCEHCGAETRNPCDQCDGDKVVAPALERRYGWIVGLPLNRALLAFGLSLLPDHQTVTMGTIAASGTKNSEHLATFAVAAGDWRLVVMSVREDAARGSEYPRFEL
jgi:hypothetical protein